MLAYPYAKGYNVKVNLNDELQGQGLANYGKNPSQMYAYGEQGLDQKLSSLEN